MESNFFLGFPLAIFFWVHWFSRLRRSPLSPNQPISRFVLGILLPVACWTFLLGVLARLSAKDVQSDAGEIGGYWLVGLAWTGASQWLLGLLGVSMPDDVLERRNPAAGYVVAGQLIGVTCCFAGANIGNGPGPEVVVFCAALATIVLVVLWLVFDRISGIVDHVTIDRELGAGIRAGAWFTATGIVLGASVAGDWQSASGTVLDFLTYSWPALVLAIVIAVAERLIGTREHKKQIAELRWSTVIAFAYIGMAVLYVYKRGLS